MAAAPGAVVVAAAGLGAWITGLWWLGTRAITAGDGLDRRHGAIAGTLIALGGIAWVVGLHRA
ncbi:MAG: hypothetical protein R2939_05745 [Kofleriaceae bacterium]